MTEQKTYWEEVFIRYKASGLSQPEFCKQNNISWNQFQYRWYERNKALKAQAKPEQFESISVIPPSENAAPINLCIHLPNHIRCEVTMDLTVFTPILTQLVQLC